MNRLVAKYLFAATVFAITVLGIRFSKEKIKIANEQTLVTSMGLGQQAQAYCNEADPRRNESNTGLCSGTASDPSSRCISNTGNHDCVAAW